MKLNEDQLEDFKRLKNQVRNDILTEPALTNDEIDWTVKASDSSTDPDYYFQLKSNRPTAKSINLYLKGLKRRSKGRVKEAEKAEKVYPDYQNIKNKLGLSQSESIERVKKELDRLKNKSDATWKALKLNKKKVLKDYDIE